jgi:drug/metabolite transporter (DMT)-like permease
MGDAVRMRPALLTAFALTAFAFNSILCRMALAAGEADPAAFTAVRLVSGAAMLALLVGARNINAEKAVRSGQWLSAFFLLSYAVCFSFAYIGLSAGTGALLLFGSVQLTMVGAAISRGDQPSIREWAGLAAAFGGLVYLVFPGLTAPPLISSLLMAAAGIAWGGYTLRGKGSGDPLGETAGNFIRSVPMALAVLLFFLPSLQMSARGFVLAVLSGALASGVGYAVWYAALRYHTATRAAVLQLAVPVIAAAGGIVLLAEAASVRLVLAGALILGGIAAAISGRR